MKNYKYTEHWFRHNDLSQFLPINTQQELHMLEIGSFEGESTVWFLENLLSNPKSTITCIDPWTSYSQDSSSLSSYEKEGTEWDFTTHKNTFLHNIMESGVDGKVVVNQGYSNEELPKLITQKEKYNIIFIDGNHVAPMVLMDAVMSFPLLTDDGIIIFDDYEWVNQHSQGPKLAIDSFIQCFSDYFEIIWSHAGENRKAIKRK